MRNLIVLLLALFSLRAQNSELPGIIRRSLVGEGLQTLPHIRNGRFDTLDLFTAPKNTFGHGIAVSLQNLSQREPICRVTASLCSSRHIVGLGWGEKTIPIALVLERADTDQPTPHAIHQVGMDGQRTPLIMAEDGHQFNRLENGWLLLDDGSLGFNLLDESPTLTAISPEPAIDHLAEIRAAIGEDFTPLYGPVWVDESIFLMAGENDPAVNLFALRDGDLMQLTDARTIFADAPQPLLSASVEFIAPRPAHDGFLYRARVRDAEGSDHNALFWHDLTVSHPMPFFGKDPVWSSDGDSLAGSTFDDDSSLYELWVFDLTSGAESFIANACNPQWSPDTAWLAYDLHQDAAWQGYTDCYANGQVEAVNLVTGGRVSLSEGLQGFVTLIAWLPE